MPNGDLHIDFRKAEVADTVRLSYSRFFLSGKFSKDTDIGVPHQCPSPHQWSRKCLIVLVFRQKAMTYGLSPLSVSVSLNVILY